MPVNEFAVPRMEPGKQRPVESLEEARDWQRLFIGEIKGGAIPATSRQSIGPIPTCTMSRPFSTPTSSSRSFEA
jgi:hypothetical protein